jgi:hypothetical protein
VGTERDNLLGALLALEAAQRQLGSDEPGTTPSVQADVLARVLRRLQRASRVLERYPELGYGLPEWSAEVVGDLRNALALDEPGPWGIALALLMERDDRTREEELDELEILEIALGERTSVPDQVRAALSLQSSDQLAAATRAARAATGPLFDDPVEEEADWRHRRTDVVVYRHKNSRGAVIGLALGFGKDVTEPLFSESTGLSSDHTAEALDESFRRGVAEGHSAALELITDLGLAENIIEELRRCPRVRLPGALEPFRILDRSAGLPIALATLREASALTGDDLGPPQYLASGAFSHRRDGADTWVLDAMGDEIADGKLRAASREGPWSGLIAPSSGVEGVMPVRTLTEAAQRAWGRRWTMWIAARADEALTLKDYRIARGPQGLTRSSDDVNEVTEVKTDVTKSLKRLVMEARDVFAGILGGPPNSGKSTIARQLASELLQHGWQTLWLAPPTDAILTADDLAGDLRLALRPMSGQVLVILEDLERRIVDRGALDDLLLVLVDELSVPVLAIARYHGQQGPQWRAEGVVSRRSISGDTDVRDFAGQLLRSNPDLEPARPWVTMALSAAAGDLWLLVEFLRWAADNGGDSEPNDDVLTKRFLALRVGPLDGDKRSEARRIAALSLVRVHQPVIEHLTAREMADLGGRLEAAGWLITSRWMARQIVRAPRAPTGAPLPSTELEPTLAGLLRDEFLPMVEGRPSRSADTRVGAILAGAERYSSSLGGLLVQQDEGRLVGWSATAHPTTVATFLNRDAYLLRSDSRRTMARNLCQGVLMPKEPVTLRELAAVLWVLARFADYLDDQPDDLLGRLEQVLVSLVPRVLSDEPVALPAHRSRLLSAILRFRFHERTRLIRPNVTGFFRGLERDRAAHLRLARAMVELLLEQRETWHDDDSLSYMMDPSEENEGDELGSRFSGDPERMLLDTSPELREMLIEPAPNASIGVWLGWLSLCNGLRHSPHSDWGRPDWNELVDTVAGAVQGGMASATIDALWRSLAHLMSYDRGLAVRLLNRADLGPSLVDKFASSGTFGQRARLLSTLANLHALTARQLLYDGGVPRANLARRFAGQARTVDDVRGVGLLLKATADVDDTFGSARDGFAHQFAEEIGGRYLQANLRHDERTALMFHLVEGLSRAHAGYIDDALDVAADRISRTIRRTPRGWAPRLALALAQQEGSGANFLARLRSGLDVDVRVGWSPHPNHPLRYRLRATTDPQALLHFHRLAGALDPPGAPFARAFLDDHAELWAPELVRSGRPDIVANAAAAVTGTLQRAGESRSATLVLAALESAGWNWFEECSRAREGSWAVQALDHLRAMDPSAAQSVMEQLVVTKSTPLSPLARRVFDAARENPHTAASIIGAVTRTAPASAAPLLDQLRTKRRAWRRLEDDLRYVQDPTTQARAFRWLGLAGWEPDAATVDRVWNQRWATGFRWLRNPHAITHLLWLFAAWPHGASLIGTAIAEVRRDALGPRLREGARGDLEALPRLLGALRLGGNPELASVLLSDALQPAEFAARVPLRESNGLLREVRALHDLAASDELTAALRLRLEREIAMPVVVDPASHWMSIGTLAQRLGWDALQELNVGDAAPGTLQPTLVGPTIWGLGWLPPCPWRDEHLAQALALARNSVGLSRPWAVSAALTVLSAHGRLAEVMDWDVEWVRATRAHPWILAPLLHQATVDLELARFLEPHSDSIRATLRPYESRWHALDPQAQEALEAFRNFQRRDPTISAL